MGWQDAPTVDDYAVDTNTRKFLDFLGKAEGADYNTIVGGKTFEDFSVHPNVVGLRTKDGPSTAAGRYQILKSTYDDVAPKLGITDFSPESQDRIAVELIKRAGALEDIQKGDYNSAIGKLGKTWASLPSSTYQQPKRSAEWVQKVLDTVITPAYAGEKPTKLPDMTIPAPAWMAAPESEAAPAASASTPSWMSAPEVGADSPVTVAGSSTKPTPSVPTTKDVPLVTNPFSEAGKKRREENLRLLDNFVRGVADTATFGYADEIAAGLDRLFGINTGKQGAVPKTYDEALAAQRALDKEAGGERTAGQFAGALLPGTGVLNAIRAPANAGRLARAGAGAATGAIQGALYGSGSAEGDLADRAVGAATGGTVGAVTGGVLGGVLPSTAKQEATSIIKKAGGGERARIEAEVIKDFLPIANNPNLKAAATDEELATIAASLRNQKVDSYLEDVKKALKRVDPNVLKKYDVDVAVSQNKVIAPEALNAIRTTKNGNILADAIEKAQIARALTAPTPASSSLGAKAVRFGIEYTPKAVAAATGASTFGLPGLAAALLTPRTSPGWAQRLTGKATIPEVISKMAGDKQQTAAAEVLKQLGPSRASKGAAELADLARKAEQAASAKVSVGQAAQTIKQQATQAAEELRIRNLQLGVRSNPGFAPENLKITGGVRGTLQYYGRLADSKELAKGLRIIEKTDPYMAPFIDQIKQNKLNANNKEMLLHLSDRLKLMRDQGILKPYIKETK